MKKKLIILIGVSGVGKSTVSNILYEDLEGCFYLEGDKCGIMNPCIVNEENIEIIFSNIAHVLNNYIRNTGSKNIVFAWNISSKEKMNKLLDLLNIENVDVYKIILTCSREDLEDRIKKDIQEGIREEKEFDDITKNIRSYDNLEGYVLDTSAKTPKEIADIIEDIVK